MGKKKNRTKAAPQAAEPVTEEAKTAESAPETAERTKPATLDDLKRAVQLTNGRGLSLADVDAVIKEAVVHMQDFVKVGCGVRIPGLGTFSITDHKERNGVNPRTREKIVIPARRAVHFSPAKALKESVNG